MVGGAHGVGLGVTASLSGAGRVGTHVAAVVAVRVDARVGLVH